MSADLLYSAEVRWFFPLAWPPQSAPPLPPPAPVLAWFGNDNGLAWPPRPRTDRYLLLPGCTSTGVKLREGRFEIKALCRPAEPVTFAPGVTGRLDSWVKWSHDGAAAGPLTAALSQEAAGWLAVTKWRLLRAFAVTAAGVVEVDVAALPATGGTVELTVIRVDNRAWWTLGLEAVGALAEVVTSLRQLAGHFWRRPKPPLALDVDHSYAYPTWLQIVSGASG